MTCNTAMATGIHANRFISPPLVLAARDTSLVVIGYGYNGLGQDPTAVVQWHHHAAPPLSRAP